ncbi:MAG: hypothetical protein RLZZ387_2562 [Chloroflexota bacterium]|jgi:hypothetical protein
MKLHKGVDQAQQQAEALRQEAARLANHAKDQLADYARTLDGAKQTKRARVAIHDGRRQLQHAASHASDQAAAAMAVALEQAAGTLRTYGGDGLMAQQAQSAADSLEHGSEYLMPWGPRSIIRRISRAARHYAGPVLLLALSAAGTAVLLYRARRAAD